MVQQQIVNQVISLFKKHPSFRDERYGTIEFICLKYYRDFYGKSIYSDYKLLSDIDRAFRLVQQRIPDLRGNTWLQRQVQGGEISKNDLDEIMDEEIESAAKQLNLFVEHFNKL